MTAPVNLDEKIAAAVERSFVQLVAWVGDEPKPRTDLGVIFGAEPDILLRVEPELDAQGIDVPAHDGQQVEDLAGDGDGEFLSADLTRCAAEVRGDRWHLASELAHRWADRAVARFRHGFAPSVGPEGSVGASSARGSASGAGDYSPGGAR